MVLDRADQTFEHGVFKSIQHYLKRNDLLVLNDTKVLPCRLFGKRATGGKVEVFLVDRKPHSTFKVMIRPGRVKQGEKIIFNGGNIYAQVKGKDEVVFNTDDISSIYGLGVMPLPPYIKREAEPSDNIYYQTVYAKNSGAVASPTAGLHFTEALMDQISENTAGFAKVTLHVGPGTFKPVKSEDITEHKMDPEYFEVSEEAAKKIEKARKDKGRIIAVGTTSLRALESYAEGQVKGFTDLFIYPGYKFKLADCLLTNFHLPKTTLFMLVCAFCGEKFAKDAYREAVDKGYRFYSYGDAMLIL
jgi:S-adenosylmethionine:tRNA ribosyltransferase-isomerase